MKIIFVTPGAGERIDFLSSRNCRISHEIMKHEIYRDASCSVKITEMVQPCIIVESFNSKFLFLFHEIAEQISNSFFKIKDISTSCMKWIENQWSRYSYSPMSGKDFARLAGWPEKYIDKSLPVLAKWTEKDRIRPEFSVDGIRLYNFENDRPEHKDQLPATNGDIKGSEGWRGYIQLILKGCKSYISYDL